MTRRPLPTWAPAALLALLMMGAAPSWDSEALRRDVEAAFLARDLGRVDHGEKEVEVVLEHALPGHASSQVRTFRSLAEVEAWLRSRETEPGPDGDRLPLREVPARCCRAHEGWTWAPEPAQHHRLQLAGLSYELTRWGIRLRRLRFLATD